MTASPLTARELREELGLTPMDDGAPSHAALARLLRLAIARWSPTSRSEIYRWLGDLVTLAELDWPEQVKPRVEETLDQLIRLGDVEAVSIERARRATRRLRRRARRRPQRASARRAKG